MASKQPTPIVVRIPDNDGRDIAQRLALACKAAGNAKASVIIRDALDDYLPTLAELEHDGGSGAED